MGQDGAANQWLAVHGPAGPVAWPQLGPRSTTAVCSGGTCAPRQAAAAPGLAGLEVPPRGSLQIFLPGALETLDGSTSHSSSCSTTSTSCARPGSPSDVDWLLEKAPPKLRLLISTRSDPPLRLERLRLGGQITELRAEDLSFTLQEAKLLLGELDLAEADLERLWLRTEGWVGGLRLAQLSLERRDDRHAFVTSFAGDDRAVSDYLMSEVVERQPPATLDFLLRTCVVDRLTGELADALTGGHEGHRALRNLERVDGLASEVDGHGRWYRYHPLMIEVLRAESRRRLPADQPRLHRLAARWHARPRQRARGRAPRRRGPRLGARRRGDRRAVAGAASCAAAARRCASWPSGSRPTSCAPTPSSRWASRACCSRPGTTRERTSYWPRRTGSPRSFPASGARRFGATSTATALYRARLRGDVQEALAAARLVLDEHWDARPHRGGARADAREPRHRRVLGGRRRRGRRPPPAGRGRGAGVLQRLRAVHRGELRGGGRRPRGTAGRRGEARADGDRAGGAARLDGGRPPRDRVCGARVGPPLARRARPRRSR